MRYLEIATIASISLLLVLATFLIGKASSKDRSFSWIGVFLILLALNFGDGLLYLNGFYLEHPRLAGWEEGFVLLYGPTVLFFASSVTDPPFRWSFAKWVHLVPFLVVEIALVTAYQSLSLENKQFIIAQASSMQPSWYVFLVQLAALAHFLIYTLFALRMLHEHKETLKQQFSTRVVDWGRSTVYYLIGLFGMSLTSMLVLQAGFPELYLVGVLVIVAATGLFVFYVLIQALDQPPLLAAPPKAAEYSLPAADVERLSGKIRDYFERQNGYANPELTIGDLAEQLAEPVREVSHVVNHYMARNFYGLVNGYRVQAAERLLAAGGEPAATITDVMYEVGFSSKSSFNTQFKKKTGLTPSEYRKRARSGS